MNRFLLGLAALAVSAMISLPAHAQSQPASAQPQAQKTLKIQTSWPASSQAFDQMQAFGKRLEIVTGGRSRSTPCRPARSCRRSRCSTPRTRRCSTARTRGRATGSARTRPRSCSPAAPAAPFGMDMIDSLGWMYDGGGIELCSEFYQKELKLNVHLAPDPAVGPAGVRLVQAADQEPRRLQGHEVPPDRHRRRGLAAHGHDAPSTCPAARSSRRRSAA